MAEDSNRCTVDGIRYKVEGKSKMKKIKFQFTSKFQIPITETVDRVKVKNKREVIIALLKLTPYPLSYQ